MGFYIGFDIGGTKCTVSIAEWQNQEIKILERKDIPTENRLVIQLPHSSETIENKDIEAFLLA